MVQTCRQLHAELVSAFPGGTLSRLHFEMIVAPSLNISSAQVRNLLQTGQALGLWTRVRNADATWTVFLTMPKAPSAADGGAASSPAPVSA